ncbi:hypothetical protein, partial [Mycobacterium tuberculosis]
SGLHTQPGAQSSSARLFAGSTSPVTANTVNTAVNAQSAQRRRKCLIADLTVCRPALDLGYRHDRRGGSTRGDSPRP